MLPLLFALTTCREAAPQTRLLVTRRHILGFGMRLQHSQMALQLKRICFVIFEGALPRVGFALTPTIVNRAAPETTWPSWFANKVKVLELIYWNKTTSDVFQKPSKASYCIRGSFVDLLAFSSPRTSQDMDGALHTDFANFYTIWGSATKISALLQIM